MEQSLGKTLFKALPGWCLVLSLVVLPFTARSEVVAVDTNGFVSEHEFVLDAIPLQAYVALTRDIHLWWDGTHSFGGSAAGFTLTPQAGGCLCETLPRGGSVEHLRVVNAQLGVSLTLRGGLGPLQTMGVSGSMMFLFEPHPDGSLLRYRYAVGGYAPGGLAPMAEPVDRVQGAQLKRLQQFIATGEALNRNEAPRD